MEPKCKNHPDRESAGLCAGCGEPFCRDCLYKIGGKYYCYDCAPKPEEEEEVLPPRKCRSIFVGLALLLGPTGAHFFYSGSTAGGVAMLMVSALSAVIGGIAGFGPAPLILMWIVSVFQSGVITTDGYGRPMI